MDRMLRRIKNRVGKEIDRYLLTLHKKYSFDTLSPELFRHIRLSLLQNGKRIRPSLFVLGYLGFAKNETAGLYTSALSTEFLHNFILIHDDIIDRSGTRRGNPSMHKTFDRYLKGYRHIKFTGQDLAIVLGDVMYALGIYAFLAIDEDAMRKERALKKLIDAAVYTASGEFLELLAGTKDINTMTKEDIYKIYDLKTGLYSFATPLAVGAILAGAEEKDLDILFRCGLYLGRAFQIKDDLADNSFTDLREGKRTILLWYAYNNSDKKIKTMIKIFLNKRDPARADLLKARKIMIGSGAMDRARKEAAVFAIKAKILCAGLGMRQAYKNALANYSEELATF